MVTIDDVVVRDYRADDLEAVLALREMVFGPLDKPRERRRCQWQFDENPLRVPGVPEAWVIEHQGRVVGHYGLLAARVAIDGVIGTSLSGMDFAVDLSMQGRGLGNLIAERFMDPTLCDMAYVTSPKPGTLHLLQKYGGMLVGCASEPCLWVFPLASERAGPPPDPDLTLKEVVDFDARFDELDERLCKTRRLTTVRSAEYLNWRYRDYPFGRPTTWEAIDRRAALRGFATLHVDGNQNQGYVAELAVEPEDGGAAATLLAACVAGARAAGANELYMLNRLPGIHRALEASGFHRVEGHTIELLCRAPAGGPRATDWYATSGDGDLLFHVGEFE